MVTHNTIHFIHICTIAENMKLELSEFLALELMQCSLKEEFCRFGAVPFVNYVLHCGLCNTLETVFSAQCSSQFQASENCRGGAPGVEVAEEKCQIHDSRDT